MTITRKLERRRAIRNTGFVAMLCSLLVHGLLVAIFVPGWLKKLEEPPPPPPERELEIEAVYEEIEAPKEPPAEPTKIAVQEPPKVQLSAKIDDASKAPAMMASLSTPPKPEPEPAPQPTAEPPPPDAMLEPPPVEEQSPIILKKPPPARTLLMPTAAAYEEVFSKTDVDAREHARERSKGKRLFANYEKVSAGVRESLTSFGHEVNPGNHTGVDAHSGAFGSYIGMIHEKIHTRWANGYLMDLDLREPGGSPMNDPTLNTLLEFVIRADDGELEAVNIVRSSGQVRFDAQAIAIAHSTGPHRNPPPELVSPNGRVYVHWNFWRDQRQCGTFGASVFIVSEQGGSPG